MAVNYGFDTYCLSDVGLSDVVVTDPFILIGQRILRRLTTTRGALANIGDDPNAGWDVRQLINARISPATINQYQSQIQAECTKDEEVQSATVTITGTSSTSTLTISIQLVSAAGPFTLVLPVANLTAAQIFASF